MNKGKLSLISALLVAVLVAFGVVDKDTALKLLSNDTQQTSTVNTVDSTPSGQSTSAQHSNKTATQHAWHGWSDTQPQINLSHIFQGEINRRGKPTGFHSRPSGNDPESAKLKRVKAEPNRHGVYTAQIAVYDAKEKRWKEKFSSFFPDQLGHQQVVERILHAWKNRKGDNKTPWRGPSGDGYTIEGYMSSRGGINTAYPIYVRD